MGGALPHSLPNIIEGPGLVPSTRTVSATRSVSASISGGSGFGTKRGNTGQIATSISIPGNTVFSITIPITYSGTYQVNSWQQDDENNWYQARGSKSFSVSVGGSHIGTGSGSRVGIVWERQSGTVTGQSVTASNLALNNRTLSTVGNYRTDYGGVGYNRVIDGLSTNLLELSDVIPVGNTSPFNLTPRSGSLSFAGTTDSGGAVYRFAFAGVLNDLNYMGGAPSRSSGWTQSNTQTYDSTAPINQSVPTSGEIKLTDFYGSSKT